MQEFLNDRATECENLSKERNQMRNELDAEILKLRNELHMAIEENTSLRDQHAQEVIRLD